MLLVVTYSKAARTSLRNVSRTHEETFIRRFGRAALLEETEHGAFLALRLREKHPDDVQVERTEPLNEFRDVPDRVCEAASAFENRPNPNTSYAKFSAGGPYPSSAELKRREL